MAEIKKTIALFKLMERFLVQNEISNDDAVLLDEFECSYRTLERYLLDIEALYDHVITIKQGRKKVWKLVSVSDVFEEFIKNSDDISNLFLMAREYDPDIFDGLEQSTLDKVSKGDENVFLFRNSMMEEIQSDGAKAIFNDLKTAIREHQYRDIHYRNVEENIDEDIKPLRLLFMENNWYLAFINNEKKFKLRRLSFMEKVKKRASQGSFQTKDTKSYLEFLKTMQNPFTLYEKELKIATIKTSPVVAKYFQKDMKKFLSSQVFVEVCEDGGVRFKLTYTQELEILPFIQKWMPDLVIEEPKELKEAYTKKLKNILEKHSN